MCIISIHGSFLVQCVLIAFYSLEKNQRARQERESLTSHSPDRPTWHSPCLRRRVATAATASHRATYVKQQAPRTSHPLPHIELCLDDMRCSPHSSYARRQTETTAGEITAGQEHKCPPRSRRRKFAPWRFYGARTEMRMALMFCLSVMLLSVCPKFEFSMLSCTKATARRQYQCSANQLRITYQAISLRAGPRHMHSCGHRTAITSFTARTCCDHHTRSGSAAHPTHCNEAEYV